MKNSNELVKIKQIIRKVLKKHNIARAGIFGSYVRGDNKKGSDVDVLVEIKEVISLFDFVGIKLELEDALGRKVDLVEYGSIKPALKRYILEEEVKIL